MLCNAALPCVHLGVANISFCFVSIHTVCWEIRDVFVYWSRSSGSIGNRLQWESGLPPFPPTTAEQIGPYGGVYLWWAPGAPNIPVRPDVVTTCRRWVEWLSGLPQLVRRSSFLYGSLHLPFILPHNGPSL